MEKKKKSVGLSTKIFLALIIGALLGVAIRILCGRSRFYPPDANACSTIGILFASLWKYGDWRHENAW